MRKCELWDNGRLFGVGTVYGFAGTVDSVRCIVEQADGFLHDWPMGAVKMLPDATKEPAAHGGVPSKEHSAPTSAPTAAGRGDDNAPAEKAGGLSDSDQWHSLTCDGTCSPPCKDAPTMQRYVWAGDPAAPLKHLTAHDGPFYACADVDAARRAAADAGDLSDQNSGVELRQEYYFRFSRMMNCYRTGSPLHAEARKQEILAYILAHATVAARPTAVMAGGQKDGAA